MTERPLHQGKQRNPHTIKCSIIIATRPVFKENNFSTQTANPLPILNTAQHTCPLNKLEWFETKITQQMFLLRLTKRLRQLLITKIAQHCLSKPPAKLLVLSFFYPFSPPHRRSTKLLSCRPTGVIQNNKLTTTQATKLQAYRHTGEIQKRQVYCNTGKTSYRFAGSQVCYPSNKMKKPHAYCPTSVKR